MGMSRGFSKSSYDSSPKTFILPNPNPKRCKITGDKQIGEYLIIRVLYFDAKNFEGNKILVYKKTTLKDLQEQLINVGIDPHFSDNTLYRSPIARFTPTNEGIEMAIKLCEVLNGSN